MASESNKRKRETEEPISARFLDPPVLNQIHRRMFEDVKMLKAEQAEAEAAKAQEALPEMTVQVIIRKTVTVKVAPSDTGFTIKDKILHNVGISSRAQALMDDLADSRITVADMVAPGRVYEKGTYIIYGCSSDT